jgi:hypothetical protein
MLALSSSTQVWAAMCKSTTTLCLADTLSLTLLSYSQPAGWEEWSTATPKCDPLLAERIATDAAVTALTMSLLLNMTILGREPLEHARALQLSFRPQSLPRPSSEALTRLGLTAPGCEDLTILTLAFTYRRCRLLRAVTSPSRNHMCHELQSRQINDVRELLYSNLQAHSD